MQEPVEPHAEGRAARTLRWLGTPAGIASIFVAGLAIRLLLISTPGFPTDMSAFRAWAERLADRGPWDFYPRGGEEYFVDYPPGYLYVLWVLGSLGRLLGTGVPDLWVKIPPVFADLGLAWAAMTCARRLSPAAVPSRRATAGAIGAAAIALNPVVIFVSSVWGQADSVVALMVVGSFLLLGTGVPALRRDAGGMALLALAVGTKPQAGFVIPVVLLLLVWRYVRTPMAEHEDRELRRRAAWLGTVRVGLLGLAGVAAGFAAFAPFRLFPVEAFRFYLEASRTYRVTSVFAFNLWGAVGFWRPDSGEEAVSFFGIPAVWWGLAVFIAVGAVVLARAWEALRDGIDEGRVLVFGSLALTLVAFAVVTRIHERYLFLPLALAALLVSDRALRRWFAVLTTAFGLNVLFPYLYYRERETGASADPTGLAEILYGTDIGGARMRLLSLAVAIVCLAFASSGWRHLRRVAGPEDESPPDDALAPSEAVVPAAPFTLGLHAVSRRGAAIALGVFALAALSRIAGLGHPPGMYFDEVYHARTGAEYLGGREVFEYTHPPFAKEVMGFSIHHLSGFRATSGPPVPPGTEVGTIAPRRHGVAWVGGRDGARTLELGRLDDDCALEDPVSVPLGDVVPAAVAVTPTAVLVAGSEDGEHTLLRLAGGQEAWRARLAAAPESLQAVGERAFVVTAGGELVTVGAEGDPDVLAVGAGQMAASDDEVWVVFGEQGRIAAWDAMGERGGVIEIDAEVRAIAAPMRADRVFVALPDEIVSYETATQVRQERIRPSAELLATVPEQTLVWAVNADRVRAIEPHSGVVIGTTAFERAPQRLLADGGGHRLIGADADGLMCASGRPQFAWRLGSAITGAAIVMLVFLLALRLFGSIPAALLASLFVAVCGLAFTIARIAMNDSYLTAFVLGAWFCILSALYAWGRRAGPDIFQPLRRDRAAAVGWMAAAGVCIGLGLASKWPALYAVAGIGLLLLWDAFAARERSLWRLAGGFVPTTVLFIALLGVVPLAIYVATYIPYFNLGHGFGDLVRLQRDMFGYHAGLTADHPFGSPWWGWPLGYRAVFLYLDGSGASRSEIWTMPNVVVIWGGIVAMAALARSMMRTRSAAAGIVLVAAAVQYLPWAAVGRVTFMYHFLPVVPFLAIALGWLLVSGLDGWRYRRVVLVAVPVAAVALFLFLYPILVGWEMPVRYLDLVRDLFPWVI